MLDDNLCCKNNPQQLYFNQFFALGLNLIAALLQYPV